MRNRGLFKEKSGLFGEEYHWEQKYMVVSCDQRIFGLLVVSVF